MDRIATLVDAEKEKDEATLPVEASVYQEIPEDVWTRAPDEVPEEVPEKQS